MWCPTCPEEDMPDGAEQGRDPAADFTVDGPAVRSNVNAVGAFHNPPARVSGHDCLAARSSVNLSKSLSAIAR